MTEEAVDLDVPSLGGMLGVARSYNSLLAGVDGPLGFGWSSRWFASLSNSGGEVTVRQGTGTPVVFDPVAVSPSYSGPVRYVAGSWVTSTLVEETDGSFTYTERGGSVWRFDASGRLVSTVTPTGDESTFGYTDGRLESVSDVRSGRSVSLTWDLSQSTPHLHSVTDPAGRVVTYGYTDRSSDSGVLADVVQVGFVAGDPPMDVHRQFEYDSAHRLTNVRFAKQVALGDTAHDVVNTFDSEGRVTSQVDNRYSPARVTTLVYDYPTAQELVTGSTTVTDPSGRVRVDTYVDGQRTKTVAGVGGEAMVTEYDYVAGTGALAAVRSGSPGALKAVSVLTHDAEGNVTSSTDVAGRVTSFAGFTRFGQPMCVTDPAGVVTTLTYDGQVDSSGDSTNHCVGANANVDATQAGLVTLGQMVSVCTPVVAAGSPRAYSRAAPVSCDDAGANSITAMRSKAVFRTDRPALIDSTVDAEGHTTSFGYDTAGLVISMSMAASTIETLVSQSCRDAIGRVTAELSPKAVVAGTTCATVVAGTPFTAVYELDGFGVPVKATDGAGHVTSTVFNTNHEPVSAVDADNNTTTFVYANNGVGSEVVTVVRPIGSQATAYDPAGRMTAQIDAANAVTAYTYDSLGRLKSTTDPAQRTTTVGYDGDGNVEWRQDPGGDCEASPTVGCVSYGYDASNQLTSIDYSDATPDVGSVAYDVAGRRTSMQSAAGTSTWGWDSLGRLMSSSDPGAGAVGYGWDLNSNLTSITYPGNKSVTRHYDDAGRFVSVTDWNKQTTTFTPDANGNIIDVVFPTSGANTDGYGFDNADRMTSWTAKAGATVVASETYGRTDSGLLSSTTTTGSAGDSKSYGYDANSRLCWFAPAGSGSCETPPGGAGTYSFDTADNLSTLADGTQAVSDPANQLCYTAPAGAPSGSCTTPPAGSTTYGYDGRGNRTSVTGPSGVSTSMGYDAESRLTSVTAPAGDNAGQYHSVDAARVLDTRDGSNTGLCPTSTASCVTIPAGGSLSVQVAGQGGIPSSGVAAVALNALAFSATDGQLTVWDGSGARPDVASLSYSADVPVSNTVVAKLDADGRVTVWSSASADVLLDVSGWWSSPTGTAGGELHVLSPSQVVNTVSGSESGLCPTSTAQCATIPAGGTLEATVAGHGGVPTSGVAQVVVNVVAADMSGPGWVTAYGGDDAMPANATVIYDGTGVVSALAVVNVSATGTIKLTSVFASSDVIVEVEGWISAGASADGTRYVPADSPARVLDTRAGTRAGACPATTVECATLSGGPRTVQIAGQGPVPAGVSSVLATVTVFNAASLGVLQAYPAGGSAPGGLSMVFNGGVPVTQLVALPLNTAGQVTLLSPFTAVDVTIDVVGWNVAATGTWAYGYNPDGLRAAKTPPAGTGIGATTFTWDRASGLPMLLAQDQVGVGVTYFIYGPGGLPVEQITPDGTTWLHHDQIGSTRLATDASGAVVGSWAYDPYGNQTGRTGTIDVPLGYTGQYTDNETGYQYLRARYYDPGTGTFLTRDPLNTSTRSAYGYVYGDPLNASDPSGLWAWDGFCVVRFNCNESAKNAVGVCLRGVSCLHGERSLADTYSWARDVRSTAMAVLGAEAVAACALMWSACAPLLIAANAIGPTAVLAYGVARAVWHELHGECDPQDTDMISSGLNGSGVPTSQNVSPQAPLHWSPQSGQNNLTADRGVPYPNPVPQNGRSNVRPGGVR